MEPDSQPMAFVYDLLCQRHRNGVGGMGTQLAQDPAVVGVVPLFHQGYPIGQPALPLLRQEGIVLPA